LVILTSQKPWGITKMMGFHNTILMIVAVTVSGIEIDASKEFLISDFKRFLCLL
jgi:hypothetical protein